MSVTKVGGNITKDICIKVNNVTAKIVQDPTTCTRTVIEVKDGDRTMILSLSSAQILLSNLKVILKLVEKEPEFKIEEIKGD